MAKQLNISTPVPFPTNTDPSRIGNVWTNWKKGFDTYLTAGGITDVEQKKALLLHCGGEDLREIFDTLTLATEDGDAFSYASDALAAYFTPKKNKRYERHIFRNCAQEDHETMNQYVTRLRTLAKYCEFTDSQDEIIDQVIEKCKSSKLRKTLLKQENLNLTKLLEVALITETVSHQSKQYDKYDKSSTKPAKYGSGSEDEVNRIQHRKQRKLPKSGIIATRHQPQTFSKQTSCFRCGHTDHLAHECEITRGKTCHSCGKVGHFSTVCKSSKSKNTDQRTNIKSSPVNNNIHCIAAAADSSSDDDDWVLTIDKTHSVPKSLLYPIMINQKTIPVLIDSGSTVNILSHEAYKKLSPMEVQPHHKNLYAFNSENPLPVSGSVKVSVSTNTFSTDAMFLVIPGAGTTILGKDTAICLDLLRIGPNTPPATNSDNNDVVFEMSESDRTAIKEDLAPYTELCTGFGCLKDAQGNFVEAKIHKDESVRPRIQRTQRFPPKLQKQLEEEINSLLKLGIIEKVEKPPTWLNPLVIVEKKDGGGVRICVDMRVANTAVIREPYQIPTLDEISQTFKGCKYFTKLDLNKGYHQIPLDEESRDLTAFQCHLGIFRYTRLIFGLSSAAEIYQREIEIVLTGIPGVRNISDDIIIGGRSKIEVRFRQNLVLERLQQRNLTINLEKSKFMQKSVLYMGHVLSAKGISPDQSKIVTINALKEPENVKELQSFLGMVTYCSKFLPNFATVTAPLRQLLKKDIPWQWTEDQRTAFQTLKSLLLSSETLAFFNPDAYTEIVTDASPFGLGAVILQRQADGHLQPVSYASRALHDPEKRYSQVERESLAIYFAINRFRVYLYGMQFSVKTDHKPLVTLFKPTSNPPPRIENWITRLMPYNFDVRYLPGKENGADYLSRSNPIQTKDSRSYHGDNYINAILSRQLPKSVPTETLQTETKADATLQSLISYLQDGSFDNSKEFLQPFYANRHNLSYHKGLLMFNDKIVIPTSLREEMIILAHEGHQGTTKTVDRLRRTVWWPKMKSEVEQHVKSCHDCQIVGPLPKATPLQMTKLPTEAWLMVGCDLCGPFPTGETLLVCVDYHSRYPEVEILNNVKTSVIVSKLRKLFCRYGAPNMLVTDNGPQFISQEFKDFMTEFNIKHRRVTPYHPIANGEVERFNRNLKKCIQTALSEGIDWKASLQNFLLNYRTAPHATTGASPAELLFGRQIRDKLPSSIDKTPVHSELQKNVLSKDSAKKKMMKDYADKKRNAQDHSITVGQKVLITNNKKHRDKYTPKWHSVPGTVTTVKGNSIILDFKNKSVMRSSCQVKPYFINTSGSKGTTTRTTVDIEESSSNSESDFYSATETIPYDLAATEELSSDEDAMFLPIHNNEHPQEIVDNDNAEIIDNQIEPITINNNMNLVQNDYHNREESTENNRRQRRPPQNLNDYIR